MKLTQTQQFEELVGKHLSFVYDICFSYMKNEMDAEDAAQETFIKAWKNLSKYDSRWELTTWLGTIAKRTCLDLLKKKKSIPVSQLSEAEAAIFENQTSEDVSMSEMVDRSFRSTWVNQFLSKLSYPYQEVLRLYYEHELNFREIAAKLGVPIDTVKSRHRRALISLKKMLS